MTKINHDWQFRQADTADWMPAKVPGCVHTDLLANQKISDPFYRTNERDQQWIDKKDWEYKTVFNVEQTLMEKDHIELFFEGLDTYADVYVNDSLALKADNMHRQWTVNVKSLVKPGNNELRILFHSPITIGLEKLEKFGFGLPADNDQSENGGLGDKKVSVFTRKAGYHFGWDWGPRFVTSGIWRPVHLITWNEARIENLQILQNHITKDNASLTAVFNINSTVQSTARVEISSSTEPSLKADMAIRLKPGPNKVRLDFDVPNPKLWWTNGLGEAFLYKLKGELKIKAEDTDQKETTIGIRTLKIVQKPDASGKSFYLELNGVPVFMKGANYIPNDNFLPRVTPEIYEKVVKSAVDANMNMLRVWGGGIYENDCFYDLCDKYGILLWQDFMFACAMYPGDADFVENIRLEAIDNVRRLRNHPSIALWCGNNEVDSGWKQFDEKGGLRWKEKLSHEQHKILWNAYDAIFNKAIPSVIAENDSSRLYWPSSPYADKGKHATYETTSGDMHYWGVWHDKHPFPEFKKYIGRFMSEYGFQSFPEFKTVKTYTVQADWDIFSEVMEAHQRSPIGNKTIKAYMEAEYKVPSDFNKLLYVGQVLQAEGVKIAMEAHRKKMPYCMGSLFWQINDCWPVASWSSIDYNGRWKALQYFAKKAYQPFLVSPDLKDGAVSIYVVSDQQKNTQAILDIKIIDFKGKKIFEKKESIEIKGNTSAIYFTGEVKNMTGTLAANELLLSVSLLENEKILSTNVLYFMPVKDLILPKTGLSKKIREVNGEIILELFTDKLVKNLYLYLEEGDGFFSDNYFDMLPKEKIILRFKPFEKIDVKTFEQQLQMTQMGEVAGKSFLSFLKLR